MYSVTFRNLSIGTHTCCRRWLYAISVLFTYIYLTYHFSIRMLAHFDLCHERRRILLYKVVQFSILWFLISWATYSVQCLSLSLGVKFDSRHIENKSMHHLAKWWRPLSAIYNLFYASSARTVGESNLYYLDISSEFLIVPPLQWLKFEPLRDHGTPSCWPNFETQGGDVRTNLILCK